MAQHTASIHIEGLERLQKKLAKNTDLSAVKTVVQANGARLTETAKRNTQTAFVKGYTTGQTASSINLTQEDGGLTAVVMPTTEYAAYVEYGTRFMAAEPYMRPAVDTIAPKFVADLKKLMR